MALEPFTTDDDLIQRRRNIMDLGVSDFSDQHLEAARQIVRDLKLWYETQARDRGINPRVTGYHFDQADLMAVEDEVKPSAILLALSLAYELLSKDMSSENDGFQAQRDYFRKSFDREWGAAKLIGFTYDWYGSDDLDDTDRMLSSYRTLRRQ